MIASVLAILSSLLMIVVGVCVAYLWLIGLAALLPRRDPQPGHLRRFAIAIPAHNEQEVIGATTATLQRLDYPHDLMDIFVAADNCSDQTAKMAREQGAICYERQTAMRDGKGAALSWLFERIFNEGDYEAVVVFDADTQVEASFLQVMNRRLSEGRKVIQGKHIISNSRQGWFPALTWAMMAVDCRFFSLGRANLGFSARHMGDSICFRADVLKELGWGSGLTEDYELRLRLLLNGISIYYEPCAMGYGQAPLTWQEAQAQRLRWAAGVEQAGKAYRRELLAEGIKRGDARVLDGFLSVTLPSYSALTLISGALFVLSLFLLPVGTAWLAWGWAAVLVSLFLYPVIGLALERAPGWAYLAILSGPLFMAWRTWIKFSARLHMKNVGWVRTNHRSPS